MRPSQRCLCEILLTGFEWWLKAGVKKELGAILVRLLGIMSVGSSVILLDTYLALHISSFK